MLPSKQTFIDITLEQEVDVVALNIDTAIPCGLIINELVSNALKHAFPDKNPGLISINQGFPPQVRESRILRSRMSRDRNFHDTKR